MISRASCRVAPIRLTIGVLARPGPHGLGAGAGLAGAAAGQDQPIDPIALRRALIGPRPERPIIVEVRRLLDGEPPEEPRALVGRQLQELVERGLARLARPAHACGSGLLAACTIFFSSCARMSRAGRRQRGELGEAMVAVEPVQHFQQTVDRVEIAALALLLQLHGDGLEPRDLQTRVVLRRDDPSLAQFVAQQFLDALEREFLRFRDFAERDAVDHGGEHGGTGRRARLLRTGALARSRGGVLTSAIGIFSRSERSGADYRRVHCRHPLTLCRRRRRPARICPRDCRLAVRKSSNPSAV